MEKNLNTSSDNYDYIFIGTGIAMLLKGIKLSNKKKILFLESNEVIGGAWKNIDIFGYKNVENAIHYLLPNKKGINYLKNKLSLPIEVSKRKYRVINFKKKTIKIEYDNQILYLIVSIILKRKNKFQIFKDIFYRTKSIYFTNGSYDLNRKIKSLVKKHQLKIKFKSKVSKIFVNSKSNYLQCMTNNNKYYCKKIYISSGLKDVKIDIDNKILNVKVEKLFRPSVHFLIKNNKIKFNEYIFENCETIKYVHNVTRFNNQFLGNKNNFHNIEIFILALRPSINKKNIRVDDIMNKLKNYKCISEGSILLKSKFFEIYLPELNEYELNKISEFSKGMIETFITDNFTKSLSDL